MSLKGEPRCHAIENEKTRVKKGIGASLLDTKAPGTPPHTTLQKSPENGNKEANSGFKHRALEP